MIKITTHLWLVLALFFLVACGGSDDIVQTESESETNEQPNTQPIEPIEPVEPISDSAQRGQALYESTAQGCLSCHGADGQSTRFKPIDLNATSYTHSTTGDESYTLEEYLERFMPTSNPSLCVGECTTDIAAYIRYLGSDNTSEENVDIPVTPETFVPSSALSGLNKTKALLNGGAVTDEELDNIAASGAGIDQIALKAAIAEWMDSPEFETKFKAFLQLALQQDNVNPDPSYRQQFDVIAGNRNDVIDGTRIRENFKESFVRTAYRYVAEGQDFRNIATTRNWDVTTALLAALSYADNEGRTVGGISMRDFDHLCGDLEGEAGCEGIDDYTDWRTITLTQGSSPANFANNAATAANLRSIGEGGNLALLAPRVGFFTTPVFLQSWESNSGNQFRVTVNQAMITGLGLTFDPGDITPSGNLTAVESDHAGEDNPECFACHRMLDPMRQVFSNQYDVDRSRALEGPLDVPAAFAFHGAEIEIQSIDDLGQAIFDHPHFATGWTAKVCNWATSDACDEDGSEFKRLVSVFENSGYDMKALVIELFASPIVTQTQYVDDFASANTDIVLNRTNHFCTTMEARLNQVRASRGVPDSSIANICDINNNARSKSDLLPQDEYARGSLDLIQSVSFDPFISTGYSQLCESVAGTVIRNDAGVEGADDNNYRGIFDSREVDQSIDEMTTYVLGIPPSSDNYSETRTALKKMYDIHRNQTSCEAEGLDPISANADSVTCGFDAGNDRNALIPVWNLVCSSPSLLGMGF